MEAGNVCQSSRYGLSVRTAIGSGRSAHAQVPKIWRHRRRWVQAITRAQARIIQAIRLGATYALAAWAGGISYDTQNERHKQFSEFSEPRTRAEAEAVERWLSMIGRAMPEDRRAAAWILERRNPSEYRKQQMEHSGTVEVYVTYTNDWRGTGTLQQANTTEAPRTVIHFPLEALGAGQGKGGAGQVEYQDGEGE